MRMTVSGNQETHPLPRAYNGVTVEGIPNFGMLYGPKSNLSHNSLILVIEAQSRYISKLVDAVLDSKTRGNRLSLTPKLEVVERYNSNLQRALKKTSFVDPNCNSWWKNSEGIITNNWSGTAINYQNLLANIFWDDYDAEEENDREKFFLRHRGTVHIGRVKEETRLGISRLTPAGLKSWLCLSWLFTLGKSGG